MKRYTFTEQSTIPESVLRDPVVLELVNKMRPNDVVDALVKDLGLHPSDAALAAGALIRHSNDTMCMPLQRKEPGENMSQEKDLEKLAKTKKTDETFGMSAPDSPMPTFMFPDEEEESEEWPYDAGTIGVMNSPLAFGPRMTT